jgi:hypothetical protein
MRGKIAPPQPVALACALLLDGKRALFLVRKRFDGKEEIGLPCIELMAGDNPAAAIGAELRRCTGIDGHVGAPVRNGKYNCGSRKRRAMIPAMAFEVEARNTKATPSAEYCGVKWLEFEMAEKCLIARKSAWMFLAAH